MTFDNVPDVSDKETQRTKDCDLNEYQILPNKTHSMYFTYLE